MSSPQLPAGRITGDPMAQPHEAHSPTSTHGHKKALLGAAHRLKEAVVHNADEMKHAVEERAAKWKSAGHGAQSYETQVPIEPVPDEIQRVYRTPATQRPLPEKLEEEVDERKALPPPASQPEQKQKQLPASPTDPSHRRPVGQYGIVEGVGPMPLPSDAEITEMLDGLTIRERPAALGRTVKEVALPPKSSITSSISKFAARAWEKVKRVLHTGELYDEDEKHSPTPSLTALLHLTPSLPCKHSCTAQRAGCIQQPTE
jgi:hypothetical protein